MPATITPDAYICRQQRGLEWEIPINFKVEEYHFGTNQIDDPSHCAINEKVYVAADVVDTDHDVILWKEGEALFLTEEERSNFEQEEFQRECENREEAWAEYQWRSREDDN